MGAETAGNILGQYGPLGLALILLVLLLLGFTGAFLAFIKWSTENTVPRTVYDGCCQGFTTLGEKIDALRMENAGGHKK